MRFFFALHAQHVVGVNGAVGKGFAHANVIAFIYYEVFALRDAVLLDLVGLFVPHDNLNQTFGRCFQANDTLKLGNNCRVAGASGFKQLRDSGQTAGDIFGTARFAPDFGKHVAGFHFFTVLHHQDRINRQRQVYFFVFTFNADARVLFAHTARGNFAFNYAGYFVAFFLQSYTFNYVGQLYRSVRFGQHRDRVRVPFREQRTFLYGRFIRSVNGSTVLNLVFFYCTISGLNKDRAVSGNTNFIIVTVRNNLHIFKGYLTVNFSNCLAAGQHARSRTTDVERTQG